MKDRKEMGTRLAPSSAKRSFRVLAVDFGTTRCKASVIRGDGRVLTLHAAENRLCKRGEGVYEQDAEEFGASLTRCVRKVLDASRGKVDIAVVTGQGSAPVCLDGAGKPAAPVISHLDARADTRRKLMTEALGPMGYVPAKLFPNLLWLKENEKKRFDRVRSVLDVREYIGYLLTGVRSFDRRGLRKADIERMCQFVGLEADAFGEEHNYSVPIGNTSSLAERRLRIGKGVPVLQAPGDTVCAAIGSGISGRGFVCDVTGSTEVVAALVPGDAKVSASSLFLIPHLEEGKAFLFMSPPLGFVFKWFVETFYDSARRSKRYSLVDRDVSSVEVSERNPVFVPSTRTVGYSYRIESHLLGLSVSHTRAHLARSVMEGLAMRVRMALDGVRANGMPVERVRLSGGGANSEVWNQLRTDVFGVETELIQTLETSSLGAAMVAAVSAGRYGDALEAEQNMVHATRLYRPRAQAASTYDSIYASFVRKMEAIAGSGS